MMNNEEPVFIVDLEAYAEEEKRRQEEVSEEDIENMLESKVNLQLWVKVKKDWRDSEFLLKNFGYNQKEYEQKKEKSKP